tara:strand:- start:3865 stop:6048 length:2184 start_codon:yes stop_codon:yes gene_type:complete
MVDDTNLEKEYVKLLTQLTKQTQLLEKTFNMLETRILKTNTKYESQITAQEEWTKRVKSDNRTANLFSKVRIKEIEQADDLYKVRLKELQGRKDIAKILSSDKVGRIKDNRLRAKERIEQEEHRQEGVKRNILMRKSMQGTTDKFSFITNSLTKGRGLIPTLGLLGKGAYNSANSFKALQNAQSAASQAKLTGSPAAKKATAKTLMEMEKDFNEKTVGNKHLKDIAEKLSKAGTFFENNMTGILIGAGAAGVLIGIIKKAVSVSPMFQQMMKLMSFAVTMILRPIGDFIGFFLRPILILLLRKFILPWFKASHGKLIAAGTATGEVVVDWIEDLTGENGMTKVADAIGKAFVGVFAMALVITALKELFKKAAGAIKATFKVATPDWLGKLVIKMPLMPDWVKKLFAITPEVDLSGGGSDGSGGSGGGGTDDGKPNKTTTVDDGKIKTTTPTPDDGVKPKNAINKIHPNQGSVNTTTGETYTREETLKRLADKQAADVKYSTNASKSDKLLDRVKSTFKKHGLLRGIQSLQSIMPKLKFGADKMSGLRALISTASIKGIGGSLLGSVLGGGAGATGLPWMIAENLDNIPQAKEFRLWFQSKMHEMLPEIDGTPVDSAFKSWAGTDISNPASNAIKEGVDWFRDATGLANGGVINEPINGVGLNSGRKYQFGEHGSEAVVPLNGGGMGGGGTTVNINISNMSGDRQDVEKLRKTILEVLQQTSMSRVRA